MTNIHQILQLVQVVNVSETVEDRAEMESNVYLAEAPSVDRWVDEEIEPMDWSVKQLE